MKDAVAALQELNPDIERNLKVQAAVARWAVIGGELGAGQYCSVIGPCAGWARRRGTASPSPSSRSSSTRWRRRAGGRNSPRRWGCKTNGNVRSLASIIIVSKLQVSISNDEMKRVFKMVDVDESGNISRTVRLKSKEPRRLPNPVFDHYSYKLLIALNKLSKCIYWFSGFTRVTTQVTTN